MSNNVCKTCPCRFITKGGWECCRISKQPLGSIITHVPEPEACALRVWQEEISCELQEEARAARAARAARVVQKVA